MKISKAALFGGTLMTAGIANAAQLEFVDIQGSFVSYAYSGVFDSATSTFSYERVENFDVSTPEVSSSSSIEAWTATGSVTRDGMLAEVGNSVGAAGQGRADAVASLGFGVDTIINVDWSFGSLGNDTISIQERTDTGQIVQTLFTHGSDDGLTGSMSFTFEADKNYFVFIQVVSTNGADFGTVQLTAVPAPGAAALAGLAGLAAVRRRR